MSERKPLPATLPLCFPSSPRPPFLRVEMITGSAPSLKGTDEMQSAQIDNSKPRGSSTREGGAVREEGIYLPISTVAYGTAP